MLNHFFIISIVLFICFIIVAIFVSIPIFEDFLILDKPISLYFSDIPLNDYFNQFMVYLTLYGREYFWGPVLVLLFILGGRIGRKSAIITGLSILILVLIGGEVKNIIDRDRPNMPNNIYESEEEQTKSFPSGHALIVSAGATGMMFLYRGNIKRLIISLLLAVEAALVIFSRVYLGLHYPLDVLGGILLGVSVTFLILGFQNQIETLLDKVFYFIKAKTVRQ